MITIIADPHAYRLVAAGALRASAPAAYVPTRIAIRRALDAGQPLVVHVTDRLLIHWLDDLEAYANVQWERVTPEDDFRRCFGREPGPPFTTALLIALDIAHLPEPPPESAIDPVAWVLRSRLDPLWSYEQASPTHLAQLLGWARQSADSIPSELHPLMQQRLCAWAEQESAYAALHAGSFVSDASSLIRRFALQAYDQAWLEAQGIAGLPLLQAAPISADCVAALRDMTPALERYWRQQRALLASDARFVDAALAQMCGWSQAELGALAALLHQHAELLNQQRLLTLRQRFAALPGASATLDELEALVPPPTPELPEALWSDTQWLRWATHVYMPYFTWVVRAQQPREHQQACALAYEDWLVKRYPEWLYRVDSPILMRQFTRLRDLLSTSAQTVVVWLVVDGMSWWQGRLLREICQAQGLFAQRYEAAVALLPSLTAISKRALVTGIPQTTTPRTSIAQAARDTLAQSGVPCLVSYEARELIEALRGPEPPRCLLWFSNTLDELAHERPDLADDRLVRGYLEGLAQNLARMHGLCTERGFGFQVLVGSDHGSTLLPKNAPTRSLPQSTREVVDVWEDGGEQRRVSPVSARAAVVADGEHLQLDQPDAWHQLDRQSFQLPQSYLAARGYAAVGRRPSGWTHGGLTPEETLVPLMQLAPERPVIEPLQIIVQGQLRSRQPATLSVVLINPNVAPLDAVTLEIGDLAPVSLERITAGERYETTALLSARAIETTELPLAWTLHGSMLGVTYQQTGEVRLAVRRLQTEDSFDDMFG